MLKPFSTLVLLAAASASLFAQGKGTVIGQIFDAATGRPIPLVQIAIDGVADSRVTTDTDGRFQIPLSPGKYKFRYTIDSHLETTVDEVEVTDGQVTDASTVLQPKGAVTTVEVVEKIGAIQSSAESILTERKLATSVSDSISSDDIKGSPASDAAGALEKVTGVSVVDNGYVFVRGLGERYSATMLNNAILPSTEPERRVVPLDLFPASLIDNIKILKTYSADLPGEFSGGLVQMQTIEFPVQRTLNVSVSYGINSQTTGKFFDSFRGGGLDFFGFDDGTRGLPSIIPSDQRLFVGNFTDQQFQDFGRAFPVNYTPVRKGWGRPTQTYSISGGNTFGRLGIVGAITFNNTPQRFPEQRAFLGNAGGGLPGQGIPFVFSDYRRFDIDNEGARLGAVLNLSYRLNPANKIVFRNTLTHDTDKEARVFSGLDGGTSTDIESTRIRWTERRLISTGVQGDHAFSNLKNSVFTWQFTYADSNRDEPDLRETIRAREVGSSDPYQFVFRPLSGTRFFSTLQDRIYEPAADWSTPFFKGKFSGLFKAGFRSTIRRRDFQMRRFRYIPIRTVTIDTTQPTETVLGTDNIRPDGFRLTEITASTDRYNAEMDILGGYGLVDFAIGPKWRFIAGSRFEDAQINVTTIDPLVPGARPTSATLNNRDPLPAVNAIYALSGRQNLRFGYGRTVNRPDFRELSPFEFTNVVGGYTTVGNPNLLRAKIENFDVRWEWFLGGSQVIAASYFYKRFESPIESTYQPTGSELRQSFANVDSAANQGIELEFRRNMAFLTPRLRDFALQANFTFVDSNVNIPDTPQFAQLTSRERPLVGQSRYIYNVIGEWVKPQWRSNARFYANSVSRRISDVGTFQLPDIYQERVVFLDFVYQFSLSEKGNWTLRFNAENLGDNTYRYTQGNFLVRQFNIGRTFTIGTSYSFF
jgi:outer membrane receptor protein involved in Fe transport